MDTRRLLPVYMVLGVVALVPFAGLPLLLKHTPPPSAPQHLPHPHPGDSNPMSNPPGAVDHLVMTDTPDAFQKGTLDGLQLLTPTPDAPAPARLVMTPNPDAKRFPRRATWTSPEVEAEFPFTELIPSWNLTAPDGTGVYFEVRTRDADDGAWSPWLYIGYWGRVRAGKKVDRFEHGTVNTDNLTLDQPADAYQIRAVFQSFNPTGDASPALRRVAVVYSGIVDDPAERDRLLWKPEIKGNWAVDLKVPYRPQGDSTAALAGQICSPTSTSMVMQFCGVDRPTVENALAIYDNDSAIFGNWGRAVARAGELGLDAWVTRFRTWDQVKAMIAAGQPIICSIKAKKGDFHGPHIYADTAGHLIVIRGLTPDLKVIVNDPARRSKGDGFLYDPEDIERVWFAHGGVAYLIHQPPTSTPTTRPVVASK